MAKETCWNCSAKMAAPVPFCPTCGQPTRHATDSDRLDFDLRQWRAHLERGGANGGSSRPSTRVADRPAVAAAVARSATPAVTDAPKKKSRHIAMPTLRLPTLRLPKMRSRDPGTGERVLDLDDPFAYTECATCQERDWILRGSRNDDGTFNYWCVRCSRSFKTSYRLAHGPKPFVAAGVVLAILVAMLVFLR
jgi:hypothetical protein